MATIPPDELARYLAERLRRTLPGRRAQRLASPPLSYGRHHGPVPRNARRAAVMVLLYPEQETWHLPLILRTRRMLHHRGQVAFPGGGLEAGENAWQAARRELHEELGVWLDDAALLGSLSPLYVYASNFDVRPLVAVVDHRPDFRISPDEVEELLRIPLHELPDVAAWQRGPIPRRAGQIGQVPQFRWRGHVLWGASAMILAELQLILRPLAGAGGEKPD